MALKCTPPLTIFVPKSPSRRTPLEVRFSRWNNANAEKFLRHERTQKDIEDEIRLVRRYESASKIADNFKGGTVSAPPPTIIDKSQIFKSVGTPSSPSRPSIPGKRSKYSKPPKKAHRHHDSSHPAFSRIDKVPIEAGSGVTVGEKGIAYRIPNAPFEFQYSYTETPKVKPLALREAPFMPFGPSTMPRPWTGRAPHPPSKKKLPEFDSFKLPPPHKKGVKPVQTPGPFLEGKGPKYVVSRDEILGEPLTEEEIKELIQGCLRSRRQLNMGRDGLTHNMLDNIHAHWKRRRVCKIKCKGVCTVDMNNVCQQLEEKTGGKIIYRRGGVLFLFRGRNYNYRTRPRFPVMLWKPITPVYPRLIQQAPDGLTMEEAREMRKRGHKLLPICKLGKNGVYSDLVKHVREAFEECELVRINCQGMNGSDYRKIGAKLKDLVPCVLVSFAYEHILMWRGRDWKSSFSKSENGCMEVKASETDGPIGSPPNQETSASCAQSRSDNVLCTDLHNLSISFSGNQHSEGMENISDSTADEAQMYKSSIVGVFASSGLPGSVENSKTPISDELLAFEDQETSAVCAQSSSSSVASHTLISGGTKDVFHDPNEDESSAVVDIASCSVDVYESPALSGSIKSPVDQVGPSVVPTVTNMNVPSSIDGMGSFYHDCEAVLTGARNSFDLAPVSDGTIKLDDEVHASLEDREHCTELARSVSSCTEGVTVLWKEAIENGNAVVLDDSSLDSDIIYDAAVSLAKVAPPGPIFRQGPRKVLAQNHDGAKHEGRNLDEVVSVSERKMEKRSSRNQRMMALKGVYSDTSPQGSLGVDELAKLLA